jgi:hypothetical protein
MSPTGTVHIEVEHLRRTVAMCRRDAGLLAGLPDRCLPRCFALVDVPARQQPPTQTFVLVQHDTPTAHDHACSSDMDWVSMFVERTDQPVQLDQKASFGQHRARVQFGNLADLEA